MNIETFGCINYEIWRDRPEKGNNVRTCDRVIPVHWASIMNTKCIEKISKALADETRLRIFEAIAATDNLTCGELVSLRGVTPATISHHLKILTEAELIECRKEGQFVHSRTIPETIAEYSRSLARISKGGRASRGRKR
jgi:ArsR family transcriptional regulator, arsenate/arsenite/antimonite-responsive transcriptional repressor